jgi:hypothetical protein
MIYLPLSSNLIFQSSVTVKFPLSTKDLITSRAVLSSSGLLLTRFTTSVGLVGWDRRRTVSKTSRSMVALSLIISASVKSPEDLISPTPSTLLDSNIIFL